MRNKMKNNFVLIIVITALISATMLSCKKDELSSIEKRLVGEWAWISSTGGLLGVTLRPDNEGFNESYLFQKNGKFTLYRDTLTLDNHFYWIEIGSSIYHSDDVFLLKLGNQDHTQVIRSYSFEFSSEEELRLWEECNDCFEIILKRKV